MSSLQGYVDRACSVRGQTWSLTRAQIAFTSSSLTDGPSSCAQFQLSQSKRLTSVLQGTLRGYDQKSNVVLSESVERIYSADAGVDEAQLGLYLVKGDTMCVHIFLSGLCADR